MRLANTLLFEMVVCLWTIAIPAGGQSLPTQEIDREAREAKMIEPLDQPKLSPGAEEIARTIGVMPLIERLYHLPERDRGLTGGTMSLEALSLRQEITEIIVGASLEVDGLITEIDNELARISAVRAQLGARRDHALALSNLGVIIASGATGVAGTALQFKDDTAKAGNVIGVAGGGISTILSLIGLHQQHGGKLQLGVAPNMLAKIFDRQPGFHSDYPKDIWIYLNSSPPAEPGKGTRREQLLKQWADAGRIELKTTPKAQHKIELLTSGEADQPQLTIDVLDDRAAMLADARAMVSLMKRDLSKLILALRS